MAGETYSRSESDVKSELATNAQNAQTRAAKLEQEIAMAQRANAFTQPTGLMSGAQDTGAFDVSMGTSSGGKAYYMPVDFGSNVMTGDRFSGGVSQHQMPERGVYDDIEFEKGIQEIGEITNAYRAEVMEANKLGKFAARNGWNIKEPNPYDPDQMAYANLYENIIASASSRANRLVESKEAAKIIAEKGLDIRKYSGQSVGEVNQFSQISPRDVQEITDWNNGGMGTTYYDDKSYNVAKESYDALITDLEETQQSLFNQGLFDEADKYGRLIKTVEVPTFDRNKILDRAEDARQANLKKNKGNEKDEYLSEIFNMAHRIKTKGEVGYLAQDLPDAAVIERGGNRYLIWNGNDVGINVESKWDLMNAIVSNSSRFAGVNQGDLKRYDAEIGWAPTQDENWETSYNKNVLRNLPGETGTLTPSYREKVLDDFEELIIAAGVGIEVVREESLAEGSFLGHKIDNIKYKDGQGITHTIDLDEDEEWVKLVSDLPEGTMTQALRNKGHLPRLLEYEEGGELKTVSIDSNRDKYMEIYTKQVLEGKREGNLFMLGIQGGMSPQPKKQEESAFNHED